MTKSTSKVIPLKYPFEFEGVTYNKITLHRPRAKDLRVIKGDGDEIDQGFALLASCARLPVEVIDEMDADDFVSLSELIVDFFPEGETPKNGGQ